MAICCNCNKQNIRSVAGWIHALRGQIVVVYFFASIWKTDVDWLSGDICKGIFLSFEEQGANRGVPWRALLDQYPWIFEFVGISGLLLDFSLFCVLMFLPPGHKLQSIAFLFHGFTGYTMSQRIGYSFPLAMIFAGFLFKPMGVIERDQKDVGGDVLSHFGWLKLHFKRSTKEQRLALLFLLLQWMIPARMPIVSNGEFKYTFEGYRWSWTMMLHAGSSMKAPGLFFMTLLPECPGFPRYPNPLAQQMPVFDVHSVPWEMQVASQPRTSSIVQMYPRQFAKVAHYVNENMLGKKSCTGSKTRMKASYFSSTNEGPHHRIIDPTVDLLAVHEAQSELPWLSKLYHAIIDRAPEGHEFILRGSGSIELPLYLDKDEKDAILMVDRSGCLAMDPIRIHANSFRIEFNTTNPNISRLKLTGCSGVDWTSNCMDRYVEQGETAEVPVARTVLIMVDDDIDLGSGQSNCSETIREDLVIRLTNLRFNGLEQQQQQPQGGGGGGGGGGGIAPQQQQILQTMQQMQQMMQRNDMTQQQKQLMGQQLMQQAVQQLQQLVQTGQVTPQEAQKMMQTMEQRMMQGGGGGRGGEMNQQQQQMILQQQRQQKMLKQQEGQQQEGLTMQQMLQQQQQMQQQPEGLTMQQMIQQQQQQGDLTMQQRMMKQQQNPLKDEETMRRRLLQDHQIQQKQAQRLEEEKTRRLNIEDAAQRSFERGQDVRAQVSAPRSRFEMENHDRKLKKLSAEEEKDAKEGKGRRVHRPFLEYMKKHNRKVQGKQPSPYEAEPFYV